MIETIFSSVPQLLAVCLVMAAAQAVYVLFGFGAGLIAVGASALLLPQVTDVVVLLALVCLPSELGVVLGSRREIAWRGVARLAIGVGTGVLAGTYVLARAAPAAMLGLLAVFLIVIGLVFLALPERAALRWPRWAATPIGLASGLLSGLFGTGGPPLILYYQLGRVPKAAFRGNLMAVFLVMTLVRLPAYAASSLITVPRLLSAALVLPAALAGAWLGHRVQVRISEAAFRRLVSAALVAIGLLLLLR